MFLHTAAVPDVMVGVQTRFVRDVLEVMDQQTAGLLFARLERRLPSHLLDLLRQVLAQRDRAHRVDFDGGIELLRSSDEELAGGRGAALAAAGGSLAARLLSGNPGLVVAGDPQRTLRRLQVPFERPFSQADVALCFPTRPGDFALELRALGRPRAARALGDLALGHARAAAAFSGRPQHLVELEWRPGSDRCHVVVHGEGRGHGRSPVLAARRSAAGAPRVGAGLAERVESILASGGHGSPRTASAAGARPPRARDEPAPPTESGLRPAVRAGVAPAARKLARRR